MTSSTAFTRRMIETPADFQSLASAWDELAALSEDPLLSYDWFAAAAATLHGNQRLQVATVWRDNQLAAAAPLVEIRRSGTAWLEFIGSRPLYEPCDVLCRDADALRELVALLVAFRRPMAFQRVPAESRLASILVQSGSGWVARVRSSSCRRVDLRDSWDTYLSGRSSECRAGFPRKRAKLAAAGAVSFESLTPDPAGSELLLNEFVAVEASSWKWAAGSALSRNPRMEAFFRELLRRFGARGQVQFCFLRCGGRAVAAQFSLQYAGRIWELKIGYDDKWRAASPGRLLLFEMLRHAFAGKRTAYEFLGAGDGQQADWSTSEYRRETVVYYPPSINGAVAAATDLGSALTRRANRMLTGFRRR